MLGKNLSENDLYLLKVIYKYGGYIRVKFLKYLFPDMSERTYQYKLNKLEKSYCLIKRRFIYNSDREPHTFQITQTGCKLCGNINSTYRRKRPSEYAYRSLLKCAFFLEIHSSLSDKIINDVDDRRKIFQSAGFSTDYFPKKINYSKSENKNVSIVQFEEYIIDFRTNDNKALMYDNNVLYSDSDNTVIIIHIDQPIVEINKQIETLVNRYILMINQHKNNNIGFSINFLVVVDSDNRYELYNDYISKYLENNAKYQEKISDKLELLYITFYEKLVKKDNKFYDYYNKLYIEYENGSLKNRLKKKATSYIDNDKVKINDIKKQIALVGIKYISDEIYSIVKSNESFLENARLQIETLFDIVAYLEYNNEIYLDDTNFKMKYNIKLYKTEMNIYG